MAHKWVYWVHHPFYLRGRQRLRAGDKISSEPQVSGLATSVVPSREASTLSVLGKKSAVAHKWGDCIHNPFHVRRHICFRAAEKSAVAHKWANSVHKPYGLERPECYTMREKINGPQVGALATILLLFEGLHTHQSSGQCQQRTTNGPMGYITPTVWGVVKVAQREAKSVAHK